VSASLASVILTIDEAYYQDTRTPFHFARDKNGDIRLFENYHRGIDKFGHIYSTSMFSQNLYFLSRWSGYSNKSASYIAAIGSITLMTGMEIWDAHFEHWGFSVGDFMFNIVGGTWPVAQQNIPVLRNFDYKMSYNFLRNKSADTGIHDYENMTFWFTMNPAGFFKNNIPGWFPNWINLAVGYGLESYKTQRHEIFISLDYNLKRIKTNSIFLRQIIAILDRFHLPAPAIRIAPDYVAYGFFF